MFSTFKHHGLEFHADTQDWRHEEAAAENAVENLENWVLSLPQSETEKTHAALTATQSDDYAGDYDEPEIKAVNQAARAAINAATKDWLVSPALGYDCYLFAIAEDSRATESATSKAKGVRT
jgi:hypothetical protein